MQTYVMATFFKSVVGAFTYIAGTPLSAAKSTYDALTTHKNFKEAWQDNDKHLEEISKEVSDVAQNSVDDVSHTTDKFLKKNPEIEHLIKHSAPHIGKKLGEVLAKMLK